MAASCRLVESLSSDEQFSQDFLKNVKKRLVFISFITKIKLSMPRSAEA
jgi:hypothetical protein